MVNDLPDPGAGRSACGFSRIVDFGGSRLGFPLLATINAAVQTTRMQAAPSTQHRRREKTINHGTLVFNSEHCAAH
ncbi:hypothetical protein BGC31_00190 [Komagataeibacter xylinus]|nr:hypothetical protein BGC31_00190 [Komagataeibacter xylinus]RFP07841.1 hypothetical protein BFX83_05180 [Komagataeibacter xylinus]